MDYEVKLIEKDAIEMAEDDENLKTLKDKDNLVLASAFAMLTQDSNVIDRWNVNYFNSGTGELSNFLVKSDEVAFVETSKRIHDTEIRPLDVSNIAVSVTEILSLADEKAGIEFPYEANKIFITLHHNGEYKNECWTITFFSKNLFLYKIKIDAITGDVVNSEMKHLLK
ncbi:MAG: hypothetical protein U9O53_01845 [archaeon]|nr:hypothetical protein [archaeon]